MTRDPTLAYWEGRDSGPSDRNPYPANTRHWHAWAHGHESEYCERTAMSAAEVAAAFAALTANPEALSISAPSRRPAPAAHATIAVYDHLSKTAPPGQLVDAVVRHLKRNPETRHLDALVPIVAAMPR